MNDEPTLTALRHRLDEVRDSLGGVHMTVPASEIFATDRRRRTRHWLAAGAGATAAVAVAVGVALPASHPASEPGARLAAWTVTRQADGNIEVSFFGEPGLRDPAGLQRALRADGVPASVTFIGQQNPACQPFPSPSSPPSFRRPPGPFPAAPGPLGRVLGPFFDKPRGVATVIHPSALPSGAGLQIAVMRGIPAGQTGPWPYPKGSGHPVETAGLVKASAQCTGS
jgi:hypothetical protein